MRWSKRIKKFSSFNPVSKYVYLVSYGLLTQIVSILLPPSSTISDSKAALCNFYITKLKIFHVHIDCDSQYFLLDSQNPMRIVNDQTPLQDRPVYTFIVFIISKFLGVMGVPSGSISYLGEDNIPQNYDVLNYALFLVLNAAILVTSIIIVLKVFFKNTERSTFLYKLSLFSVLLMISQNPINREFFWTPHTQIFNVLVPALLFHLSQNNLVMGKRQFYIWILSISTALLVYPTFSILLPILFFRILHSLGPKYAFSLIFALLPKLMWPYILKQLGGHYVDWPLFYHRRFIWIQDSIQAKSLISDSKTHFMEFLNSLPLTWDIISLILIVLGYFVLNKMFGNQDRSINMNPLFGILVLATYVIAMGLNGAYAPRFSSGIVLLLCFQVLYLVSQEKSKALLWKFALGILIISNYIYWFVG